MNNKAIATYQSYNPHNCTEAGYDFTLYADGSVSAVNHSRWQNSTTDKRWRSDAGAVNLSELDESDPDKDAEAMLASFVDSFDDWADLPSEYSKGNYGFRCTRKGYVVR